MLDDLPKEILFLITEHINDKADLKNLSQVSRLLYHHAIRQLYKSVTIRAIDEDDLASLGLSILAQSAQHLRYVKDLYVEATFRDRLCTRCLENDDESEDEAERAHAAFLRDLDSQISPFLQCLTEDRLQSFSWNLGTCIPRSVVDYLSNKQTQIVSLTITTGFPCRGPDSSIHRLDGFSRLRRIAWTSTGIESLKTLSTILLRSSAHLEEIKIDRGDPDFNEPNEQNQFVKHVLRVVPGSRSELFPSLRSLTLFCVSLEYGVEDIVFAFRVPQLQCLKLQDCVGTSQLLDWLATSPQGARLTSLEWNFTGYSIDEYDIAPLIKFLQSSRGLEDLFLLYPREYALEPEYWSALPHHHDTLRRVVHQQSSQKGRLKNDDEAEEMIRILGAFKRITYLGTCCQPGTLSTLLAHIQPRPQFRLLHIRPQECVAVSSILDDEVSSCDLEFSEDLPAVDEFACWAFGPNGLPDLEVLAYGDFSFQGRQPNVLLCRSEDKPDHGYLCDMSFSAKGFRELKKQDVRLWEMVQDNIDFLEACPGDYLLHRW